MTALQLITLAVMLVVGLSHAQDCSKRPPRAMNCCSSLLRLMSKEAAVKCGLPAEMADAPPGPGGPPPSSGGPFPGSDAPPPGGIPGGQRGGPTCLQATCLMKEKNLLNAGGEVDMALIKSFAETQLGQEWKAAIASSIQACSGAAASATPDCKVKSYVDCIKKNLFLSCPDSAWNSSTECNDLKKFIQTCPPPQD